MKGVTMSSSTGIEADFDQLMRQAPETVEIYLFEAQTKIDKVFGAGYAKEHPELVGAFIQAASVDFQASSISKVIGEALHEIANSINLLTDATNEVALACGGLRDVSGEIGGVASAIMRQGRS
jgi:hypothetical protein